MVVFWMKFGNFLGFRTIYVIFLHFWQKGIFITMLCVNIIDKKNKIDKN